MPRFTVKEKVAIQKKMKLEGEKLFSSLGLKKVTIDDLSAAAGISHSAFYSFYESKEVLFMEINIDKQKEIYSRLEVFLEENREKNPKQLVSDYLMLLQKAFFQDTLISSMNTEVIEQISRKVPQELMEQNDSIDNQAIIKLEEMGIEFKYPQKQVVKLVQATFVGLTCLDDEDRGKLGSVLMDALVDKIVKE